MGYKWRGTSGQLRLVELECRRLGIPTGARETRRVYARGREVAASVAVTWRHQTVTVKGDFQDRYRDLKTGRFIREP
ncbi:MAG: hypothetical protein ABSD73_05885 [Candidatus Bathyarchaeia archaeon]|jgi:hypothetical protein